MREHQRARGRTGPRATRVWDRWRPAIHVAVLLMLLIGSAVLAADAYLAHQSYASSARKATRDLALEAGAHLARTAEAGFGNRLLRTFYPVPETERYDTPPRRMSFFANALGWSDRCFKGDPCGPGLARTAFHLDLRTGAWTTQGTPLDSMVARAFRDSIQDEATHRYERSWELARLHIAVDGKRHTILYRVAFDSLSRAATAIGLEVDMPRVGRELFAAALKKGPLLASIGPPQDHMPAGASPSVRVVSDAGELYLASGAWPADTSMIGRYSRESDLGAYRVDVGVPQGMLPAIAASENTRLITTYLAFGASVLLVTLAIAQTRREYALARLRESFVAGVSHELRTPLAQIRLYAEMLEHGFIRSSQEREEAVHVIVEESARLTHLIENVLTYSRSSGGELHVQRQVTELSDVFRQLRQAMEPVARSSGVRLVTQDVDGIRVNADGAVLAQVLVNFADNAIRHGVGGKEVTIGATVSARHVRITVDDAGPGIPALDRARVWERFVRLDHRTASPGTGIGLSVAADLIEGLGGSTWIEDAPGGGARFVVQLPDPLGTSSAALPELEHSAGEQPA